MRQPRKLNSDTDLGCIVELAAYMNVSRTHLQALKKCANSRHSQANPSCFSGNKSHKQWVLAWLERNRDFRVTLVYPRKSQPQLQPS